tara:strand:- start:50 stop:184 length:135 start_codon:yes stop_codon:yes gene_type:complete
LYGLDYGTKRIFCPKGEIKIIIAYVYFNLVGGIMSKEDNNSLGS